MGATSVSTHFFRGEVPKISNRMTLFHPVELMPKVTKNSDYGDSYLWDKFLKNLKLKESDLDSKSLDSAAVPLSTFREHVLREYIEHVAGTPNLLFYCAIKDYKKVVDPRLQALWLAQIVGYRALMRWVGVEPEDKEHDFWVNLGSADVRGIRGYDEDHEVVIPPAFLENRWSAGDKFADGVASAVLSVSKYSTIGDDYLEAREKIASGSCKLSVGQRVELLDNQVSSRVRPARIKAICGRRVCVQVLKVDCDTYEDDDRQYGTTSEFWVDQASFFLFPVGWACLNNYNLEAKMDYKKHAQKIADAILSNTTPQYSPIDVKPDQLTEWKQVPHSSAKWEKDMKFELLDPLGATVRDLFVASVIDVLRDGYLKVGIVGPEMEDECIPLHCTSPLLFPVGYAEKHDLVLHTPEDEPNFRWDRFLKKTGSKAAPNNFFKADPSPERIAEFQVGAKLEASDLCENTLICPGTVVGVKGRLVMVHFDGWEDAYDQYFDIDSKDIFPLGWCEIHGYKLERPKGDDSEPLKKKKKK